MKRRVYIIVSPMNICIGVGLTANDAWLNAAYRVFMRGKFQFEGSTKLPAILKKLKYRCVKGELRWETE